MFKKTPQKQTSFVSPKGKEKQIDYILTKRRYLSNVKDAEANDMIHMGSDRRCIMATFLISTPEKNKHNRRENKKRRPTVNIEQTKKDKNINIENPELEERYQDIIVTLKKAAAKKENEAHDTRNNAKDQMERKNAAAAAEAESTLVETVAQETEGRSKKRSSKDDNQRGTAAASEAESTLVDTVAHETEGRSKKRSSKDDKQRGTAAALEAESTLVDTVVHETEGSTTKRISKAGNLRGGLAHLEHRRPDGWTSTPRGSDDEKNCSERDETSSHPLVRTGGEEDAHEIITNTGCSSSCDLRAGERLPKQRPLGDEHPERIPEEHLGAQMIHQVGEAGSIVLHNSRSSSVFKNDSKEIQETTSAKKKEECVDKDAEILRLIEERRSMPKEEKQRLKDLSKNLKNVSEKKKNEKTARHWKNPWRVQRCPKYPENQNSKEESSHHKNKERKRWMHHLSKRNRRYLRRILQKTLWRQWKRQLRTWNEGWQKNTWNRVWRTTKRNQQTQNWQVSRRKWNTSRRHQRL